MPREPNSQATTRPMEGIQMVTPNTPDASHLGNPFAEAFAQLEGAAAANYWDNPKPGDHIVGLITAIEEGHTRDGATYPILVLEQENGDTIRVRAARTALRGQLRDQSAAIGDTVAIRFLGQKVNARDRAFYAYETVVVKGASK